MERNIWIEAIDSNSPHLEAVITLGRTNARTLGQMPQGAFLDYAANKCIVVALSLEEQCVGYLMYRISKHIACIAHLCVDKDWRGKHVAKQLISHLIEETKQLDGIKLSCRRDYGLDKMWSSFGFTPRFEKPGRSKDGKLLTIWFLEHKRPKLLTLLTEQANVLKTAKNNLDNQIMAVQFSDTELFNNSIPFHDLKEILGRNIQLQSPKKISIECFKKLYNQGI